MKILAVVFVVFFIFSAQAEAGPAQPLAWNPFRFNQQYDTPIEQQTKGWLIPCDDGTVGEGQSTCWADQSLWVRNPTLTNTYPCVWDPDDHWRQDTIPGGYLDSGVSVTLDACYILDWTWSPNRYPDPGYFGVSTRAPRVGLQLTICTDADTRIGVPCVTVGSVKVGNEWVSEACIEFNAAGNIEDFPEIPNTNGGRGEFANVTVTLTNTSGQRLRDITASARAVDIVDALLNGGCN